MAAIHDFNKYAQTYESALGMGRIQEVLINPADTIIEQDERRLREIERATFRIAGADAVAASLRAYLDQEQAISQIQCVSQITAGAAAQIASTDSMAAACKAINLGHQSDVTSLYAAKDNQLASWVAAQSSLAESVAATCSVLDAQYQAETTSRYAAIDVASLAKSFNAAENLAVQGAAQLAMTDVSAFQQAISASIPAGANSVLATLRDIPSVFKANFDPLGAFGPFVHVHQEPRWWDAWRDRGRDAQWDEPDESDDDFEQTDSGIYVRKRGRPPGITDYTEAQFMGAIIECYRRNGRFPTMQAIADQINRSLKTVKRYCKRWGIDWYELRYTLRVD